MLNVTGGYYIRFADKAVQDICVANWGDGIGITEAQIAAVTTLGAKFKGNTEITSFNELEKFTGVTKLGTQEWNDYLSTFKGCTNLKSVILPDSVKQINYQVFYGCSSLSFVNLENQNIESIWVAAFMNCTSLSVEVDLPNLKSIGNTSSFAKSGITKVKNLGKITSIGGGWGANEGVFYGCASLSFVRLPNTLTSIGVQAFYNCSSLTTFIVEAETPPTLDSSALSNTNNCPIYVPDASVDAYKNASGWSSFASRIKPLSEYVE